MDSFDNTWQKAKEFFDSACKKTEEVVNVQKLRFDLSSAESKLNNSYVQLGKDRYKALKETEIDDIALKTLILDIDDKLNEVERLRSEITALSGKGICCECGKKLTGGDFCSHCGAKIKKD